MNTEQLLTTAELAEMLRVHPRTPRNWREYGAGPRFVKLGKGDKAPVRYRVSDVEAWLDGEA